MKCVYCVEPSESLKISQVLNSVRFRLRTCKSLKLVGGHPHQLPSDDVVDRLQHYKLYSHGLEDLFGAWSEGCLTLKRTGGL